MRPAGNLAGVSFIDAPLYHLDREKWREIISNSGYFFTADTMRFFDCRVSWDSLTPLGDAWLFITSERHPGGPRRYTVRAWSLEASVVSAGQFQAHDTLAAARREIRVRLAAADMSARLAAAPWVTA
jgi:hypothetical protein